MGRAPSDRSRESDMEIKRGGGGGGGYSRWAHPCHKKGAHIAAVIKDRDAARCRGTEPSRIRKHSRGNPTPFTANCQQEGERLIRCPSTGRGAPHSLSVNKKGSASFAVCQQEGERPTRRLSTRRGAPDSPTVNKKGSARLANCQQEGERPTRQLSTRRGAPHSLSVILSGAR